MLLPIEIINCLMKKTFKLILKVFNELFKFHVSEKTFLKSLQRHIPMKNKTIAGNHATCHKTMRKAIMKKTEPQHKHF